MNKRERVGLRLLLVTGSQDPLSLRIEEWSWLGKLLLLLPNPSLRFAISPDIVRGLG